MTVPRRLLHGTLIVDKSAPQAFGKSKRAQGTPTSPLLGTRASPLLLCLAIEHRLVRHWRSFAMRFFTKFFTVATIALFSIAGCTVMHHEETTGQYVDDTTLSARAKAALIKDKNVSASDFSIEVYQGHVTLTGVAKTPTEAKLAAEDIRAIQGVKSVKNDVRIASVDNSSPR
jgi:hyperosmotically inducible protein